MLRMVDEIFISAIRYWKVALWNLMWKSVSVSHSSVEAGVCSELRCSGGAPAGLAPHPPMSCTFETFHFDILLSVPAPPKKRTGHSSRNCRIKLTGFFLLILISMIFV